MRLKNFNFICLIFFRYKLMPISMENKNLCERKKVKSLFPNMMNLGK